MKRAGIVFLIVAASLLGACAGVDMCEEPAFYESAVSGKRIEVPDDLNGLAASKEIVIPEASPRPPREPGSGCLDRPPTLSLEKKET
jgi:hypothetical protein